MATNPGQSAARSAGRGAPTVVSVVWQLSVSEAFSALSALSFADQKLPLGRGHLSDEVFEELAFFDPSGHLLTELRRNVRGTQVAEQFGHEAGLIFIESAKTYKGIEDEQGGAMGSDGGSEFVTITGVVQPQGIDSEDTDVDLVEREAQGLQFGSGPALPAGPGSDLKKCNLFRLSVASNLIPPRK